MKRDCQFLKRPNISLIYNPANVLQGIYSTNLKNNVHTQLTFLYELLVFGDWGKAVTNIQT